MGWFQKHWRALLGWLAAGYGIARGFLDFVGTVDLILDHIPGKDTTWLGQATTYALTAPVSVVLPIAIVGLLFIWWDWRRNPKIVSSHSATVALQGVQATASAGSLTANSSPDVYEPLPEAARRVLEENLGNMVAEMAMSEPTSEKRLDWFGVWIADTHEVPIYGKRPPSQKYELVPYEKVRQLRFAGGATELWETWGPKHVVYIDLAVKPDDLAKSWKALISEE